MGFLAHISAIFLLCIVCHAIICVWGWGEKERITNISWEKLNIQSKENINEKCYLGLINL